MVRFLLTTLIITTTNLNLCYGKAQNECKMIIFERVGYCPNYPGDVIFSEIDVANSPTFYRWMVDSTYSLEPVFGDDWDYTIIYECKDSLDLDLVLKFITKSEKLFKFISSDLVKNYSKGPENLALPFGSLQIRAYGSDGKLMQSFCSVGFSNTSKWFNHLSEKSKKVQQLIAWGLDGQILSMLESIAEECTPGIKIED